MQTIVICEFCSSQLNIEIFTNEQTCVEFQSQWMETGFPLHNIYIYIYILFINN